MIKCEINVLNCDSRKILAKDIFVNGCKFVAKNTMLTRANILKTVSLKLKNIIRSTDTIYRIGGDEFIILLRNLKSITNAEKDAVAALETLNGGIVLEKGFNYR